MPVSYTHLDVYKRQELDAAREALEPFAGDVDKTGLLDAITKADVVREQGLSLIHL